MGCPSAARVAILIRPRIPSLGRAKKWHDFVLLFLGAFSLGTSPHFYWVEKIGTKIGPLSVGFE